MSFISSLTALQWHHKTQYHQWFHCRKWYVKIFLRPSTPWGPTGRDRCVLQQVTVVVVVVY